MHRSASIAVLLAASAGDETPWWVLLIAVCGVLIIILTVALAGRRSGLRVGVPDPGWKPKAREAYTEGRWLSDAMTEDLAVWRGNAQFEGTTAPGSKAGTGSAEAWEALAGRMDRARRALYGVEAAAPDAVTAQIARRVVAALTGARSALDARAEARFHYRTVDAAGDGAGSTALAEARDRELRTAQELDAARRALGDQLTRLAVLT